MQRRPTQQDISWFLDLQRNGQLDLNPPYQRRSVWSGRDRRYFLDTIFRGYPSPAIFLYKHYGEAARTVYDVVDGKQRLETILAFANGKLAIAKDFGDVNLDGKKWSELGDELRRRFWDYTLPVEFIKVVEGTVVNEVFERLNRNSRRLEPQELRHARHDGWFISLTEAEAENDDFWRLFKITSAARSRRMRDVQFISELFLVVIKGTVHGFDQELLDQACADYDVPEDFAGEIDPGETQNRVAAVKSYLRELEAVNQCVTAHAGNLVHFYSLWGWAALATPRPNPGDAAPKYDRLMKLVEELARQRDLESLNSLVASLREAHTPYLDEAYRYVENARGASTEAPQRVARHEALMAALSG